MMPTLQVRDFPQELYDELREYAARNHRSIAQQTVACVESELRRSKAMAVPEGADAYADGNIPPMVHDAASRASSVDAFAWAGTFQIESEEIRGARRAKWEELRGRFADLADRWNGPTPTCGDIAQAIRDERDGRAENIMMNVEGFLAAEGRG